MGTFWIATDECGTPHIFLQKPHRYKNIWMCDNETKFKNNSFRPFCESMHQTILVPSWNDEPIEIIV